VKKLVKPDPIDDVVGTELKMIFWLAYGANDRASLQSAWLYETVIVLGKEIGILILRYDI
jgi:hypothetical protein